MKAPQIFVKVIRQGREPERVDPERVTGLVYEDLEDKADRVKLEIDNQDLTQLDDPAWTKGNVLEVSWGYPGEMAPPRRCIITTVKGFAKLKVEAQSEAILMNRLTRSRTWSSMKRSDVVALIAAEHGYSATDQWIDDTEVVFPTIAQAKLTDAAFLRRLAAREGFEFYVDFDGFHFHPRRMGARPIRELVYYINGDGDILQITSSSDLLARPGSVTVKGRDPLKKTDYSAKGSNDETDREGSGNTIEVVDGETGRTHLVEKVAQDQVTTSSAADARVAKREADAKFRDSAQKAITLKVAIEGDPRLLAKSSVIITGISKRLSGRYYVAAATHTLKKGAGYTVSLKCTSDGNGLGEGAANKGKKDSSSPADPDELTQFEDVDGETGDTNLQWRDTSGRPSADPTAK